MQNMTPEGGQRGRVLLRSGGVEVLDTGTLRREWNLANPLNAGPKGKNCGMGASEPKIEVPSLSWVVTTRRGAGSWLTADIFWEFD